MRRQQPAALRLLTFTPAARQVPDLERLCGQLSDFQRGVLEPLVRAIVALEEQNQRARNLGKPVIDIQPDGEGA